jgi:hypothetical protein
MNSRFICGVFLFVTSFGAHAALIPYYRMDSLALLSDSIVLCEEQDVQFKTIQHKRWSEVKTTVRCKVILAFKGDLKTESEFAIEYDSLFRRHLRFKGGSTVMDTPGGGKHVVPPEYLPPGRALLFLKKLKDSDSYSIVTAKLIQGDGVVQFGQFESNPGPLVLAPQHPENIKLPTTQKYGEAQLIEDLLIALEKAPSLKEPIRIMAWEALK